jgi:cell wall assembly regulator SMI1
MSKKKASQEQIKALFTAVRRGHVRKVREMFQAGVSPAVKDTSYFNETPLLAAVRAGKEAVFFELVQAGANLHARNSLGTSVLQEAADQKDALRMVQAVIADGILPSDDLPCALRFACADGSVDVVKELIKAGADVNHKSADGETPLIVAVQYNRPENVAALLETGATTDVRVPRDELGDNKHYKKTTLELAIAEGHTKIAELLQEAGATVPPKPKHPAKPGPVASSWNRIDMWIKQHAPQWKPLKKGASAEQLASAEKKFGFRLPADLRDSYRVHNGSRDDAQIFPCPDDISYSLMSFAEVVQDWKMMNELLEASDFEDRHAKSDQGVRNDWWNTGWVPFASNGGGDYFCVDLAPAVGGKKGQVITVNHESGEHKVLAPSFREWLYRFANDLEDGKFSFDEDEGLI